MSILLWILYPIAVQYVHGGWWRLVAPITLITLVIDVLANYTELSLIFGFPKQGEYTFSHRLKRLSYLADWRGDFARWCVKYCNRFDPYHIR